MTAFHRSVGSRFHFLHPLPYPPSPQERERAPEGAQGRPGPLCGFSGAARGACHRAGRLGSLLNHPEHVGTGFWRVLLVSGARKSGPCLARLRMRVSKAQSRWAGLGVSSEGPIPRSHDCWKVSFPYGRRTLGVTAILEVVFQEVGFFLFL